MTDFQAGWGRKFSYCIAFSIFDAKDVTSRYISDPQDALAHETISKEDLRKILAEITETLQKDLAKTNPNLASQKMPDGFDEISLKPSHSISSDP